MSIYQEVKSVVRCLNCLKTLKSPILLPCGHTICKEHIDELTDPGENYIKCSTCQRKFNTNKFIFFEDKALGDLIDNEAYLTFDDKSLKRSLFECFNVFNQSNEEFKQSKNDLDLVFNDIFKEIRSKINFQCEKLKKQLEMIAFEMTQKTNAIEALLLKNFENEIFNEDLSFVEVNFQEIECEFRNFDINKDWLKQIHRQQEENISKLKSKIERINQIKENLILKNDFKPNVSLLKQELFGCLNLDKLEEIEINLNSKGDKHCDLSCSRILSDVQLLELKSLCELTSEETWTLLYQASRDGFRGKNFHSKCDGHSNTLTIIKTKKSPHIFGAYAVEAWDSMDLWKRDDDGFIFSLVNSDNQPCKMVSSKSWIDCSPNHGPSFGNKDIQITDKSDTCISSAKLGKCFTHPRYVSNSVEARSFLAGSIDFLVEEIEVYEKNS